MNENEEYYLVQYKTTNSYEKWWKTIGINRRGYSSLEEAEKAIENLRASNIRSGKYYEKARIIKVVEETLPERILI